MRVVVPADRPGYRVFSADCDASLKLSRPIEHCVGQVANPPCQDGPVRFRFGRGPHARARPTRNGPKDRAAMAKRKECAMASHGGPIDAYLALLPDETEESRFL